MADEQPTLAEVLKGLTQGEDPFRGRGLVYNPNWQNERWVSLPEVPTSASAFDKRTYLRAKFLRHVIDDEDPDSPFQKLVARLDSLVEKTGEVIRRDDTREFAFSRIGEHTGYFERVLRRFLTEEGAATPDLLAEYGPYLKRILENPTKIDEKVREAAVEMAKNFAKSYADRELTDEDRKLGRWKGAARLRSEVPLLIQEVERTVYELKLARRPHSWLSEWLLWECRRHLEIEYVRALYRTDNDDEPELKMATYGVPRWRDESEQSMPRGVLTRLTLYEDEPLAEQLRKLDAAKNAAIAAGRKHRHPGPSSTPPPAELLVEFAYRSLRDESHRVLAQELPYDLSVHEKTLGKYIRNFLDEIFSPDDGTGVGSNFAANETKSTVSFS